MGEPEIITIELIMNFYPITWFFSFGLSCQNEHLRPPVPAFHCLACLLNYEPRIMYKAQPCGHYLVCQDCFNVGDAQQYLNIVGHCPLDRAHIQSLIPPSGDDVLLDNPLPRLKDGDIIPQLASLLTMAVLSTRHNMQ